VKILENINEVNCSDARDSSFNVNENIQKEIIKERNKNSKIKVKTIKIMKRKQKTIMNSRRITVKIINNTFQRIISDNSKVSKINGKKNMKIKNRRTRNSIIRKGRINMDRNKENNM